MLLAFALFTAAGVASPVNAAPNCQSEQGRRAVIAAHFSDNRLMNELADLTLVTERRVARSVEGLGLGQRDQARLALRLLNSPDLAAQRTETERSVEQVFERLEAALGRKDEVALCGALVEANALVPVLAAKAEQQHQAIDARIAAETQKRLASLLP